MKRSTLASSTETKSKLRQKPVNECLHAFLFNSRMQKTAIVEELPKQRRL